MLKYLLPFTFILLPFFIFIYNCYNYFNFKITN